jgi:hypothetical protein
LWIGADGLGTHQNNCDAQNKQRRSHEPRRLC